MNLKRLVFCILPAIDFMPILAARPAFAETPSNPIQFDSEIVADFISNRCHKCHGPEKQEGKLRLDTLSLQIGNSDQAQRWQDVYLALKGGEMPPEDEPQPPKDERSAIIAHLQSTLQQATLRFGPGHQYKAGDIIDPTPASVKQTVDIINHPEFTDFRKPAA